LPSQNDGYSGRSFLMRKVYSGACHRFKERACP